MPTAELCESTPVTEGISGPSLLSDSDRLQLLEEARFSQALGYPVSKQTLSRWAKKGLPDHWGRQVLLRTTFIGRRRFTCDAWIREFKIATQPFGIGATPPATLVDVDISQRVEAARAELEKMSAAVSPAIQA